MLRAGMSTSQMADCDIQLWDLVRKIEPTPTQKLGAARSQRHLRKLLNSGKMAERIATSYLSGSYARNTAIHPLDDVDIIFVVKPEHWRKSFSLLFGSSDFPAPHSILDSFANAIRYRYPITSVFGQRRSVRLKLYHLDIDIVPAIQDKRDRQLLRIPDSHAGRWIVTSPAKHAENATAVNKFQTGRFKPLVKLLKYWNGNLPGTAHLKSFAIETMAVRIFRESQFSTLQEGLLYFFDFVAFISGNGASFQWRNQYGLSLGWLNARVPDTAGLNSNIIDGITNERRTRFIANALRSREKMEASLQARSLDTGCRRIAEALRI
jgi:hypothetical protein